MSDRLTTEFWVQACVKRCYLEGIAATVAHKGDPTSGTVLVKLNRCSEGCTVLSEARKPNGARAWFRGTGPAPVPEADADDYIARSRKRDPDLWVVEIEGKLATLPFEGEILAD
jgi:hypothetical protein